MVTMEMEFVDQSVPEWKSPMRKLVKFFHRSRDGWKAKYAAKKHRCKLLDNQVRAVEKSRERWKQVALQAQQQVDQLQQELDEYKKARA